MLIERRAAVANLAGPIVPSTTGIIREASNLRNRAWKPFAERGLDRHDASRTGF
jgi:hypothetical protein